MNFSRNAVTARSFGNGWGGAGAKLGKGSAELEVIAPELKGGVAPPQPLTQAQRLNLPLLANSGVAWLR